VRPGIDRVNQIIRPRRSLEDVVDNRTALRGEFGVFFLRDDYDGRLASDTDMLRAPLAGSFHDLAKTRFRVLQLPIRTGWVCFLVYHDHLAD
jgi:hypothetical protein